MQTVDHAVMQRSLQGKIMTVAKYKGADPGRLSCRVWHSGPSLHVALGQAWLGGKRSQDPYALVYLLRCYFALQHYLLTSTPQPLHGSRPLPDGEQEDEDV